jgi:hypothetical protein
MYARVVRFTEVTAERISEIVAQVEESEGPPPGVDSTGFELFVDEAQGTAVFVGSFGTEQKMRDASAVFEQMDPSETPGSGPPLTSARSRYNVEAIYSPRPTVPRASPAVRKPWTLCTLPLRNDAAW